MTAMEYLAQEMKSGRVSEMSKEFFSTLVLLFGSEEAAREAVLGEAE